MPRKGSTSKPPAVRSATSKPRCKRAPAGGDATATPFARAARRKKASPLPWAPGEVAGARRTAMPTAIDPQLATLRPRPPAGPTWIHEIKFDGYRILAFIDQGKARLVTRNHLDWTHRYARVAEALATLPVHTAILDGEVVAQLPNGVTSFQALQNAGKAGSAATLAYYGFDLLYLDGYDLRRTPLLARKELLQRVLASSRSQVLQFSQHSADDGAALMRESCKLGLEGILSKRIDRPYIAGRNDDWIKSKCVGREELVIGGYTLSTAGQRGIGALLLGYFDQRRLVFAGRVGTGFGGEMLKELHRRLSKLEQAESPFQPVPRKQRAQEVRWVRPTLVAEIEFTAWTDDAMLRHPSFQGLREDKPARSIGRPASLSVKPG